MNASCSIGGAAMVYRVTIKIRLISIMTTTTVEVQAKDAVFAKAIAERLYGKGNVLAVTKG